jgi:hypothetical protein
MIDPDWLDSFAGAITICDLSGIVLEMNEKAAEAYRNFGGKTLIGKSLIDCHPEPGRKKLLKLLESGKCNVYTVEKNGIKKLIYQAPWIQRGTRSGMIELALEIPFEMPNFVRQ